MDVSSQTSSHSQNPSGPIPRYEPLSRETGSYHLTRYESARRDFNNRHLRKVIIQLTVAAGRVVVDLSASAQVLVLCALIQRPYRPRHFSTWRFPCSSNQL